MSKFTILVRGLLALSIAAFATWYLAVNSVSWPTGAGPGGPEGYRRMGDSAEVTVRGRVQARPPELAYDSLEGAHRIYLTFLNERAPEHLRFPLPDIEELRRTAERHRATLAPPSPVESRLVPTPEPTSPSGMIELERLFFEWDGAVAERLDLEVTQAETGGLVHRFRVRRGGAWYPSDGPGLERGGDYRFRLVWEGGASSSRSFRIASDEEQRAYEGALRCLEQVALPQLRAELEVLLARADGRDSFALQHASRSKLRHPESELLPALEEELEAKIAQ